MQVTETNIQQLLGGPKQFRVPLFQRTYTWRERDHAQLWRDILAQYEVARGSTASSNGQDGHFIGSFVLAPTPAPATLPAYLSTERKFWASDDEVRSAMAARPFYYYGRAEQRRMVLERLVGWSTKGLLAGRGRDVGQMCAVTMLASDPRRATAWLQGR